mgnify:FL=1
MIKIADKDKDYVYVYSENTKELDSIINNLKVAAKVIYLGYPAAIVKKEKNWVL